MSERCPRGQGRWVGLALGLALYPAAGVSAAESRVEPQPGDEALDDTHKATAQKLFEEGRRLMTEGRVEDACRDFAESQRLDPALGTRFNLAECYETLGKLASAWVHYVGVADGAERLGQMDRARFSRGRADALEPRLARILIEVDHRVEGMSVTRNGARVGSAQWLKPIPVDRGEYSIEVMAPGYEPWQQTVRISEDGVTVTVTVPALVEEPVVPIEPPSPTVEPEGSNPPPGSGPAHPPHRLDRQYVAGIVVGGLGVVGLAVGGGFGVLATRRKDEASLRCPEPTRCFADGAQRLDEARVAGTVSTAALVVGGVLLATGVAVLATTPVRQRRSRGARASRTPALVWRF